MDRTQDLSIRSPTLYHYATAPPNFVFEPMGETTNNLGFRVRHKPACTISGAGLNLDISDLSSESKGADQLCSYCTSDLRLCFRICRWLVFWFSGSFDFDSPLVFQATTLRSFYFCHLFNHPVLFVFGNA